jgi:hypothetical protein
MATAGRIVLEAKIAVDIVLADDGKYYVDSTSMMDGVIVHAWTEGPSRPRPRPAPAWSGSIPCRCSRSLRKAKAGNGPDRPT